MSPALLTTGQSRWALHILIVLLSVVAIASSAPSAAGGASMYSGDPGDIRGPSVMTGLFGLGGVIILRTAYIAIPKPWRIYLDRVEFTFIAMLWVCWTSATMAFSAFTVKRGVCSSTLSEIYLPTCPLLTFDLILLHLLSISTLALLLVILSTTLSPSYYMIHSPSMSQGDGPSSKLEDPESTDAFVMWEIALASPSSPRLEPVVSPSTAKSYGTYSPATPIHFETPSTSQFPPAQLSYSPTSSEPASTIPVKRDKFAAGRVWSYVPLMLCSIGAFAASTVTLVKTKYVATNAFVICVANVTVAFTAANLVRHFNQKRGKSSDTQQSSFIQRHHRAVEVGCACILFLVWPLTAIIHTLFPPTPNRPCTNPAASLGSSDDLPAEHLGLVCVATATTVTLAWMASWLKLARVLGLIFPMPEMGKLPVSPLTVDRGRGEEGQSLLRSDHQHPPPSGLGGSDEFGSAGEAPTWPQMKWGRMVAGEAFELDDVDDD